MTLYQDPRAFVVGLEGVALFRAFCGEHDGEFTRRRLQELQVLIDAEPYLGDPFVVEEMTTVEGYADWAATYDLPGNGCFELDEPVIAAILHGLSVERAVDVACGTGRLAGLLGEHAREVIGVDSSPDMLALASKKWPNVRFLRGDLYGLPIERSSAELVVCALALSHVPNLAPAFAEFGRVLQPGGHLVISDVRGFIDGIRPPMIWRRADGTFGYLPVWVHRTSDYLSAALAAGFEVRGCTEPAPQLTAIDEAIEPRRSPVTPGEPPNVWELMGWCPQAVRAAFRGSPGAIIWHFQRAQ
jgi:SAM-dependent methyltransferase